MKDSEAFFKQLSLLLTAVINKLIGLKFEKKKKNHKLLKVLGSFLIKFDNLWAFGK